MTSHPMDLDKAFVDGLWEDGLDELAITEAANVGFHYNLIDRIADAFDFPVPQGLQKERLAKLLNFTGNLLRGSRTEELWVWGEGGVIRPAEVETGRAHFLSADGATDPILRRSVEAFVTAQWGQVRSGVPPVPSELETYLKKLSLHAYRILDSDVESLRNHGYSDDMIYEITVVGATGAALVGLERLFKAMYG